MTSITRQQLRDAIEAGITAAAGQHGTGFTDEHAAALRGVGHWTSVVSRGVFVRRLPDGSRVCCPVAQAFAREDWTLFRWTTGGGFTTGFDRALPLGGTVVHITDNDETEGRA